MANPKRIVTLIPHFNNPKGLAESVSSIGTGDIIIVDDGSADLFDESLLEKSYSKGKVFFLYQKKNCGIEDALNRGLLFALKKRYDFVARLDCGDVNCENRLVRQSKCLEEDENVVLIGSWCDFYSPDGDFQFTVKTPRSYADIKKRNYLNSMFIHPTVMFRLSLVEKIGLYSKDFPRAEDYDYFFRMLRYGKCINIPDVLVKIENNPFGISISNRKIQIQSRLKVIIKHFYFGFYPILGFCRNLALLIVPYSLTLLLKKLFLR